MISRSHHRIARRWLLAACAGAFLVHAQAPVQRDLTLLVGRGELLQFPHEVSRVAVAEPKIADAIVVSPSEVMINAKGLGRTTVVIWESGSAPLRCEVNVTPDSSDWDKLRKDIADLPGGAIAMAGTPESIVLTGKAVNAGQAKRAAALAATRAKNVINLIEVPPLPDPRQVMLQVKFAAIDRVGLSELGFNYFSRNGTMLGAGTTEQFQPPRFSQLQFQNQQFSNTSINFADLLNLFVFRPDLNIGATIRALQQRNLLQILAEPNLITLEGTEASFLAGGEFPFPTLTSTSTGGAVSPVVTVQFKKFGVRLSFTPTITSSGAIHLKVAPEVSALDFTNAVTLQGFLIPALSTRNAETEVVLEDGESFAIAGLIDNRVEKTLSRVRGIGDVPIIGHLFRSRSTKKSTDELLVVVTPRFVRPVPAGEKVTLPKMPDAWLPAEEPKKPARKKGKDSKQAEFVGPRGHQEP